MVCKQKNDINITKIMQKHYAANKAGVSVQSSRKDSPRTTQNIGATRHTEKEKNACTA